MILGVGVDICDIRRIEATLARFGDRFTQRVFTETERALADRRRRRADIYAKRFAAKEACAKALGTGVPRQGVGWTDMGVVNRPGGAPGFALAGGAARRLDAMTPPGMTATVHLTLTDEAGLAQAFVMITAEPS